MEQQKKILLEKTFVRTFAFELFKIEDESEIQKDIELEIKTSFLLNKERKEEYCVVFDCSLKNSFIDLKTEFVAVFLASQEIDEEFINSPFAKNSRAIGFPYLRAFITNFTINAGIPPIILPTYNFTK